MTDGWIKLHRELLAKAIWKTSTIEQRVILITILLLANHEENQWEWQGKKFICRAGQFITSSTSLAQKSGVSRQNVRTALKKFKEYEFLTYESTKAGILITLINWDKYQIYEKEPNQVTNQYLTNSQPTPNQPLTTNKNDKNVRKNNTAEEPKPNEEKDSIPYRQIVALYNKLCPSLIPVQALTNSRREHIAARFKQFKGVSDTFITLFRKTEESDFLKGKNDRGWKADFEWLMKNETNAVKVLEGKYTNKTNAGEKEGFDPYEIKQAWREEPLL